jgi:hypothetical protein
MTKSKTKREIYEEEILAFAATRDRFTQHDFLNFFSEGKLDRVPGKAHNREYIYFLKTPEVAA